MPASTPTRKIAWITIFFYGVIAVLILKTPVPKHPPFPGQLFQALSRGESAYPEVGSQFSKFKPLLPENEKITFIMDFPFNSYSQNAAQLYAAQAYLTPRVLTFIPGQRAAIVDCTNNAIAEKRLNETGYRLLLPLEEGKGIAIKK